MMTQPAPLTYRPEIDGLRALAVFAVMFFHADFTFSQGGFVGVDVFFVISGYLIGHYLLLHSYQGSLSLANFYQRRLLRILPALFWVLSLSLPLAWWLLLPSQWYDYLQSLLATLLFGSNLLFYFENGYFSNVAALKPLIHTWSLAVEEQFYLLFPLLIMLSTRWLGRGLIRQWWAIALLGCLSFAVALLWSSQSTGAAIVGSAPANSAAAFFLLPARAWQFLCGVLLAGWQLQNGLSASPVSECRNSSKLSVTTRSDGFNTQWRSRLHWSMGWGAFFALLAAFYGLDHTKSLLTNTLLPTCATLVLLASAQTSSGIGRLLAHPLLVFFGVLSYSAYLWHQVVFALARHSSAVEFTASVYLGLMLGSWLLAWLTYTFIEQPWRGRGGLRYLTTRQALKAGLVWYLLLLAIAVAGLVGMFRPAPLPTFVQWDSLQARLDQQGAVCQVAALPAPNAAIKVCYFGDVTAKQSLYVYGDSHAVAMLPALDTWLRERNIRGVKVELANCPVIVGLYQASELNNHSACAQAFSAFTQLLAAQSADVLVVLRWTFRLYPLPGWIDSLLTRNSDGAQERLQYHPYSWTLDAHGQPSIALADKERAVLNFVSALQQHAKRLYLVTPIPEVSWDIAKVNQLVQRGLFTMPSGFSNLDKASISEPEKLVISIDVAEYQHRHRFIVPLLQRFTKYDNVQLIKSEQMFCQQILPGRCVAQAEGKLYYLDDDHLSDAGAALLLEALP